MPTPKSFHDQQEQRDREDGVARTWMIAVA